MAGELRAALLGWYDLHRRELPWRAVDARPDPYAVWVSEVMLQQTRVEVVKPYFEDWMERFPTLQVLAAADEDAVLKAWEGLGYYSRARNLLRAVREVAVRYGGKVPDDPQAFGTLPGVGRYTAGAVGSIAFGLPVPVVDGNVRRVFSRLTDDPSPAEKRLWQMADQLVKGDRPGDLNQALMELGAVVCKPRNPECVRCPVSRWCAARHAGTVDDRPLRKVRSQRPVETYAVAVLRAGDQVLIRQRPRNGRMGGLWEFPATRLAATGSPTVAIGDLVSDLVGVPPSTMSEMGTVEHTLTHVHLVHHVFEARLPNSRAKCAETPTLRWVNPSELEDFALARPQRRIAAWATDPHVPPTPEPVSQ